MNNQGTDNTLTYELYLSKPPNDRLIQRYKVYLTTLLNEEPQLDLVARPAENSISGRYKFDHNIEQEWLTVYLLFELSKFDRDLVIKVRDNDGDILLIEAADHLPEWLESKESENRVFIHEGQLHIIPRNVILTDLKPATTDPTPTSVAHLAAKFIRDNTAINTTAASGIQNAIKKQMSGLPDKKAWLTKKFQQLDEIISVKDFNESLTLASVMNMADEDLEISPISSLASSSNSSSATSLSSESTSPSETSSRQQQFEPLELEND